MMKSSGAERSGAGDMGGRVQQEKKKSAATSWSHQKILGILGVPQLATLNVQNQLSRRLFKTQEQLLVYSCSRN